MEMAALKTNAAIADRAEKRGDVATAMKAEQEEKEIRARMDLLERQIKSTESEGARERTFKERQGDLNRAVEEKLTNAKIKAQIDIAKMDDSTKRWVASRPPETLRVIEGIAQSGGMSFNEALDKFLTKGKPEVSAADRARLAAAFNDLPRSERDKYNGVEDFIAQMTGGAGGMPAGVTVKKKD
jgi:hypothetical protein